MSLPRQIGVGLWFLTSFAGAEGGVRQALGYCCAKSRFIAVNQKID